MTFTGKDNIVCWSVIQYLNKETSELNDTFRSTDWGSGLAEAMCREVQHFPIPGGNGKLTLADLIVNTPRDQIAKVTLEEKVFESWYGGRTVLLGNGTLLCFCLCFCWFVLYVCACSAMCSLFAYPNISFLFLLNCTCHFQCSCPQGKKNTKKQCSYMFSNQPQLSC